MRIVLLFIIIFFSFSGMAQIQSFDKITSPLVKIPGSALAPTTTTSMLYNLGGHLYWNSTRIDTAASGQAQIHYLEHEISADAENDWSISDSISAITYNGKALKRSQWAIISGTTLRLYLDTRLYDYFTIIY